MENFFVLLIFFLMVIGPIIRFYDRWKNSRDNAYRNGLPGQGHSEREFNAQDPMRGQGRPDTGRGGDVQPPDQVIQFEEYIFSLDGSNAQIGDSIATNLSGAQAKGAQYAEKYKQAINMYKFVAGQRIWIDKIYPPGDSS